MPDEHRTLHVVNDSGASDSGKQTFPSLLSGHYMYAQTHKIHREKAENSNFSDTQELAELWSLGRET